MKRFVSRHLSIGGHRFDYSPLSSSDTQLDENKNVRVRDADLCSSDTDDEDTEEVKPQRDSGHRKRWFHVRRRKKHEGDTSERKDKTQVVVSTEPSRCDELEIAVEASYVNYTDPGDLYRHHEGSALECCTSNDAREIGIQSLDLATAQRTRELSLRRPERRFAICEELEREMVMANGMNLRKSRKNLVIRQVLHDLLLL